MIPDILEAPLEILIQEDEHEHLEFKEAKEDFKEIRLEEYCVAFANSDGGVLVLGVTDKKPRHIVGTKVYRDIQECKRKLYDAVNHCPEFVVQESDYDGKRVLISRFYPRSKGMLSSYRGRFVRRVGESNASMTFEEISRIALKERASQQFEAPYTAWLKAEEVANFIDIESYFHMNRVKNLSDYLRN